MEMQKRFLSKVEVAVALGISVATVNRRIADHSIQITKIGSRVLIPASFITNLEATATKQSEAK